MKPFVSVIVPCRNEEHYIASCLDSILESDYPQERLEVLVVDGRSEDGTREILERYATTHRSVRVVDNPRQITPIALNLAIRAARGDVLVRMDAHVVYPRNYVSRLIVALLETGADSVGAVLKTLPASQSAVARAIALGMSHPFGVGNSYFRIGTTERRWVDTIAFFCCRRETFERVGMFDEELVRHQDGEFNARLIKQGGRILLIPDVVSYYYARGSLRQVARMFFQYGYFKPLVARKLRRFMTVRQLIPPTFVLSITTTGLLGLWWMPAALAFGGIGGSYLAAVLTCALLAIRKHGASCGMALAAVLPVLHFSYGFGFLRRVIELPMHTRPSPRKAAELPLSR